MAKIIAHFSKKVPVAGEQYSSQMYSASVEADCGGDDNPETVRAYLQRLFSLAKGSVDEQLAAASGKHPVNGNGNTSRLPANGWRNGNGGNGNGKPTGNGHFVSATAAQKKAIFAICKSLNLDPAQYNADAMSVREASAAIDQLKAKQAANC